MWDESKHPRDDKGKFVDVYKLSTKELLELGDDLDVEMPDNDNLDVYRARVKEALERKGLQQGGVGGTISLTKQEWAQYYKIIGDEQHGDFVYHTTNNERWVRLDRKIVVDDNEFIKPTIKKVLEFPDNDSMNLQLNVLSRRGVIK